MYLATAIGKHLPALNVGLHSVLQNWLISLSPLLIVFLTHKTFCSGQKSSDIASLLQILCGVFSESPPVFSKPDPHTVRRQRPVSQQNEAAYATSNPTMSTPSQGWYIFQVSKIKITINIQYYYINTHEIPGKLLCKNMISSYSERSPLLDYIYW